MQKKALHIIFFKKNLHLNNSKPLVSAKQMNFRLRPRLLVFFFAFFLDELQKSLDDHVKWKC